MQIMVMEFARGVLGDKDANSSEFTPDGKHNVIALMADQQGNIPKGGTMRLGKDVYKRQPVGRAGDELSEVLFVPGDLTI